MISGEFRAISRRDSQIERLRSRLLGRTALCGAISIGALFGQPPREAEAGPQGTVVTHGNVKIQKSGTHTNFKQSSNTAILNHSSFDITVNESVNFQQPSKSALAVNRVVGSDLSTKISGKLTATGNVWVLNPSGVAISNTARINVNGLIATSARISDQDILSGRASGDYSFTEAPDGSAIINDGTISAGDGHVVLVAPVVENTGTITTKGSEIALGAGSGFRIDMDLDGLTQFEVQPGNGVSLTNSGRISAEGGAVYLSAAAAGAVESAVVSIGGEVEATRIENRGGKIVISGGEHGVTEISGKIDASQIEGAGGKIAITGELIDIQETAVIDVSGATDGGKIEIGGGFQGRAVESPVVRHASATAPEGAPLPVAKRTLVREGARFFADAGASGDGGEVIIWSDEFTYFHGSISSQGGSVAGNGGFVEISGKLGLDFSGSVDLLATNGEMGGLLLDPENLIVIADTGGAGSGDADVADGSLLFNDGGNADLTVEADAIVAVAGTVTLQATQDISINGALSLAGDSLVVDASNDLFVNAEINTSGALTFTADADSTGSTVTGAGASDNVGVVSFGAAGEISGGAAVVINSGSSADTDLGSISASSLSVTTSNNGNVVQDAGTTIVVTGNTTVAAGTGNITLGEATNDFQGTVDLTGGVVSVRDTNTIDISAASATSLTVQATNGIAAVETARAASNLTVPTLTLIDTALDGAARFTLQGSGATANAAGTLNVDQLQTEGVSSLTFQTDVVGAEIALGVIDEATLDVSVQTPGNVLLDAGTKTLQNFSVTGSGSINDDGVAPALVVSGTTSLVSAGDILLNDGDSAHDLAVLSASTPTGAIVHLDAGSITLGGIEATTLTVTSGGTILDDGTSTSTADDISVAGISTLTAVGDIILDDPNNDFVGSVGASGQDIVLFDVNSIELGNTTATAGADTTSDALGLTGVADNNGDLFVTAVNSITQTGSTVINVADTANFNANTLTGNAITIDQANLFAGPLNAQGFDMTFVDADALDLGEVNAFNGLTVTASSGGITDAGTGDISVNGTALISASADVILDDATHDFNEVDISATTASSTIVVVDTDDIVLGDIDAGGSFSVSATSIADDNVSAAVGDDVDVTGATTLTATTGNIDVDDGNNTFGGDVVIAGSSTGTTATIGSTIDEQINFGAVTAANLTVSTPADITGGNTGIGFGGTVNLNSGTGALTINSNGEAIDIGGGTTGIVSLDSADIANLDNGVDTLVANSGGGTIDATDSIDGLAQMTLDATAAGTDGAITLGAFTVANLSATGNNIAESDGTNGTTVSGTAALTATGETALADGDIVLNNNSGTGFDFATVSANATDEINLGDENSITLAGLAGDDLSVTVVGSIVDDGVSTSVADDVSIVATTTLTAGGDIVLDDANNDFGGSVTASGQDVVLVDVNSIELGNITVTAGADTTSDALGLTGLAGNDGDLVVTAGNSITQTASTVISVPDTVNLNANTVTGNAITVDQANLFAGTLNAAGFDITVTDADALDVGEVNAFGAMTLTASSGGLSDAGTGDVSVNGTGSLSATGDVIFDDVTHDFVGSVNASGQDIVLFDANSIELGNVTATAGSDTTSDALALSGVTGNDGDLFVTAVNSITQTTSAVISVPDTANLNANTLTGNAITVDQANLFAGTVNALGFDITVTDADALDVGEVNAFGAMTLTASSGGLSDAGTGDVSVNGTGSLSATGDVIFDDVTHDFVGSVNASGQDIVLFDANSIELGNVTATAGSDTTSDALALSGVTGNDGDLFVTAVNSITQTTSAVISVPDTANLNANTLTGNAITVDQANLFAGTVNALGFDITVTDADALDVGEVNAFGAMTLTASSGGLSDA
ncbi:MAG: filamentous hemagglutinin N-terminal domain-containing protein, partial [Pseudomonadota bacterium]